MKRWWIPFMVLVLLAAAGCAKEGGTNLEFKSTLAGEVHWDTTDHCSSITSITDATGTATFMDDVTAQWMHCPDDPDAANHEDGALVLRAADGDELDGVYDYPAIDDGAPITITGGTGRFANASGSLEVTYAVTPVYAGGQPDFSVPWKWEALLNGTISY
jgi:hypothetical protein